MSNLIEADRSIEQKLETIKVINSRIDAIEKQIEEVSLWKPQGITTLTLSVFEEVIIDEVAFYKTVGVILQMLREEKFNLIEKAKELMK